MTAFESLSVTPIGFIRTEMRVKFDSPSQPRKNGEQRNIVELLPNNNFDRALSDLAGFDRIWLIWWFHRNNTWRPMVLPPRGDAKRRGVFATRSPHRPNPIGISAVSLIRITDLTLEVGEADLVDGTPILDIKPYIHEVDSFPESSLGWLSSVEAFYKLPPSHELFLSALAEVQIAWLKDRWQVDFTDRLREILTRDPKPHRTRRIRRISDNHYRMGCGAWAVFFSLEENKVVIEKIEAGYPDRLLQAEGYERVPDRDAQVAFREYSKK